MTKTPYEIRLDVLNFAQNQLQGEYFAQMERIRMQKDLNLPVESIPSYPTKDDIIFLAESLKNFVDTK
jgi:hypothetical protein